MPRLLYRAGEAKGHFHCLLCHAEPKAGMPANKHAEMHVAKQEAVRKDGLIVRYEVNEDTAALAAQLDAVDGIDAEPRLRDSA
jgi:hypothetical protein